MTWILAVLLLAFAWVVAGFWLDDRDERRSYRPRHAQPDALNGASR